MIDRLIIIARNRAFPRFGFYGLPATSGWCQRAGRGSFAESTSAKLPTNSGMQPGSGPSAELMETQTATHTRTATPPESPASGGTSPACHECGGCGWNYVDYICPLSKNWAKERVTCGRCGGDGYEVQQ